MIIEGKMKSNDDPWMIAEEIPEIFFYFCRVWLYSFVNRLENACDENYKKVMGVFHGTDMKFYYGEKDSKVFEKYLVKKIKEEPGFGEKINRKIYEHSDKLTSFAKKLASLDLTKMSNEEIISLIKEHEEIHLSLYEWGWLSNATDMFHATFTNLLKKYLARFADSEAQTNKYLMVLSHPNKKSVLNEQQEEFLGIIGEIQKNHPNIKKLSEDDLNEKESELIKNYWEKFHHTKFLWVGKAGTYTIQDYINQINDFLKNNLDAKQELEKINTEFEEKNKEKEDLLKELGLERNYVRILSIYAEFMLTKAYRREAQILWSYEFNKLLGEIAQRLKITLEQAYFLLPLEIEEALQNKFDTGLLKQREKFCVYYAEKGFDKIYTGEEAEKLTRKIKSEIDKGITELKGQCGSAGYAKGTVKIITSVEEIAKIKEGEILVSIATNPDIVPAMQKAAAIVTEQGGITCHAAIVSREMGKPCVIGTKIATKILKDGDLVEVNANNGTVKILERK